jgi:hypothetical protein
METNATLIDRELATHLRQQTNLTRVAVSLDSPTRRSTMLFAAGRARSMPRCAASATWSRRACRRRYQSVHRENVDRLEALIELAVRLGARSVKFIRDAFRSRRRFAPEGWAFVRRTAGPEPPHSRPLQDGIRGFA